MQRDLTATMHEAIDGLYPSLDDVVPDWVRVVEDAEPERAPRRSRPRTRKYALRAALLGAATAAVALGILAGLPGNGVLPGTGPSSVARAANALTSAEDEILHTVVVTTRKGARGDTDVWKTQTWQQTSPPFAARQVGGRELAQANGAVQFYDPRTNTIHTTPPGSVPASPTAFDESLRERMLDLLHSGGAHEDGRLTVDGRDALRIVSSDGSFRLVVDASTFEPIEWTWVSKGGVSETSRFQTYEWLPSNEQNLALLSLTAQHPDARIREDATVSGSDGR